MSSGMHVLGRRAEAGGRMVGRMRAGLGGRPSLPFVPVTQAQPRPWASSRPSPPVVHELAREQRCARGAAPGHGRDEVAQLQALWGGEAAWGALQRRAAWRGGTEPSGGTGQGCLRRLKMWDAASSLPHPGMQRLRAAVLPRVPRTPRLPATRGVHAPVPHPCHLFAAAGPGRGRSHLVADVGVQFGHEPPRPRVHRVVLHGGGMRKRPASAGGARTGRRRTPPPRKRNRCPPGRR
jgi:hypothetical protein